MLDLRLSPIVVDKLDRFRDRRRRLRLLRSLAAGLVVFVAGAAIVALVDWQVLLADRTRWILSAVVYGAAAMAVGILYRHRLNRTAAPAEVASQLERTQPELRDQLRAAVELAADDPSAVPDSPQFRHLLQHEVASTIEPVRVARLLPLRLVGRWLVAALVAVAAAAVVLIVGGASARQLAARTLLPGANIARVSRVTVDLLEPSPGSLTLPENDTIAIIARIGADAITGDDLDEATLETIAGDGTRTQLAMTRRTSDDWAAQVVLPAKSLRYRIVAGDAITRWETIATRPRPVPVGFAKVYRFPKYAGLPNETVTETTGDLSALSGSVATLTVETDQPVSRAKLVLTTGDGSDAHAIPMSPVAADGQPLPIERQHLATHWRAAVPMDASGTYEIGLTAAETGFENLFAPTWSIDPLPDLLPRVTLTIDGEPDAGGVRLVARRDLLPMAGTAEDDLPLAAVEQWTSINGQPWIRTPRSDLVDEPRRVEVRWRWEIASIADGSVEIGDTVRTRLVATDRAGHLGESPTIRLLISGDAFAEDRHATLQPLIELATALDAAADLTQQTHQSVQRLLPDLEDDPAAAELRELIAGQSEALANLEQQIIAAIGDAPPGATAEELSLIARTVAAARHGLDEAAAAATGDSDHARADGEGIGQLRTRTAAAADRLKTASRDYRLFVSHLFATAAYADMQALLASQQRVSETGDAERQRRLQQVVDGQMRSVEQSLKRFEPAVTDQLRRDFLQIRDWSADRRVWIAEAVADDASPQRLEQVVRDLRRELGDRQRLDWITGSLPGQANNARRNLRNLLGRLHEPIDRLGREIIDERLDRERVANAADSATAERATSEATLHANRIDGVLAADMRRLRSRKAIEAARRDADAGYVSDLGLTGRALRSLRSTRQKALTDVIGENGKPIANGEAIRLVAAAYRTLEAVHQTQSTAKMLASLAERERWDTQSLAARTDFPRQWDAAYSLLEKARESIHQAGLDRGNRLGSNEVLWSDATREAGRKLSERRWRKEAAVPAAADLEQVREDLAGLLERLEPDAAAARVTIAQFAPTVPQMARQAAADLTELTARTRQAADAVRDSRASGEVRETEVGEDEPKADKTAAQAPIPAELAARQRQVNEQIDELVDALIEEANAKDLLDDEQRAAARDADAARELLRDPVEQMNERLRDALETAGQLAPQTPIAEREQQSSPAEPGDPEGRQAELADDRGDRGDRGDPGPPDASKTGDARDDAIQQAAAAKLDRAATEQDRTRERLEQLADDFEASGDPEASPESRQQARDRLRQAERDEGIERQLDEQFAGAERLAEMAAKSPEELLAELEAELRKNPEMQQALSAIAAASVRDTQSQLEDAVREERRIEQELERSDVGFQQKKSEIARQLQSIGEQAESLAQRTVEQAKRAADRGRVDQAEEQLRQAAEQLREAGRAARQSREDQPIEELADAARRLNEQIDKAEQRIAAAEREAALQEQSPTSEKRRDRDDARRDAERDRQRLRESVRKDAENRQRRAEQQARRDDQEVRKQDANLTQAERRLQQARQEAARRPENASAQNKVASEQTRRDQAAAKLAEATERSKASERAADAAKEQTAAARQQDNPPLDQPNPQAQLAADLAAEAAAVSKQLREAAEAVAKATGIEKTLAPSAGQLAQSQQQQEKISDDVQAAAGELERAARHEQRLSRPAAAETLRAAAESIRKSAAKASEQAEQSLANAAKAAKDAGEAKQATAAEQTAAEQSGGEQSGGDALASDGKPQTAAATTAREAVEEAEQQLLAQVASLDEQVAAAAAADSEQQDAEAATSSQAASGAPSEQSTGGNAKPGEMTSEGESTGRVNPQSGQQSQGQQSQGQQSQGQQTGSQNGSPNSASPAAGPEQQVAQPSAESVELARLLDELDRRTENRSLSPQAIEADRSSGDLPSGGPPAAASLPSPSADFLAAAAQAEAAAMAAARAEQGLSSKAGRSSEQTSSSEGSESGLADLDRFSDPASQAENFTLVPVDRSDPNAWGQLRKQSANDAGRARHRSVPDEYQASVDAYFRILAARARQQDAARDGAEKRGGE